MRNNETNQTDEQTDRPVFLAAQSGWLRSLSSHSDFFVYLAVILQLLRQPGQAGIRWPEKLPVRIYQSPIPAVREGDDHICLLLRHHPDSARVHLCGHAERTHIREEFLSGYHLLAGDPVSHRHRAFLHADPSSTVGTHE